MIIFIIYYIVIYVIYFINNLIIKYQANKLLYILYRLIYHEKRPIGYINLKLKNGDMYKNYLWNIKNGAELIEESIINKDLLTISNCEYYYSFTQGLIFSDGLTYNEYLIFSKKLEEYEKIIGTYIFNQKLSTTNIIKNFKNNNTFYRGYLELESKIIDDYFFIKLTRSRINTLLNYLEKNLYITNTNNIELTSKAINSINIPEKLNTTLDFTQLTSFIKNFI